MKLTRHAVTAVVASLLCFGLVACTPEAPGPTAPPPQTTEPSDTTSPEVPIELVPGGTAEENRPYFDQVSAEVVAGGMPDGKTIIDHLVAAGFTKEDMEVTADKSPRGGPVDTIQFSVKFGDQCVIGQAGVGDYISLLAPTIATGTCLVGKTRPIDW